MVQWNSQQQPLKNHMNRWGMAAGRLWAPQSVHGTGGWLVYNNSAVVAAIGKGGASAAVPVEQQQTIAKQFVDGRAYFLLLLLNGERSER